ncbi:hypothetical protein ILYODFUR_018204 [Ilyodon furcidens]|uniref:Uncharacterized protein n=1 Tax=Ilyodon furcidens TaxID=33524 RepID=A0ABV0SY31_9TELE
MKKSRSAHGVTPDEENTEPPGGQYSTGSNLCVEVCRVHRRSSGNLQLPPLSWRQAEKERDRGRPVTPEEDPLTRSRPTSLPITSLPRIDITQADPDRQTRYGMEKGGDMQHRSLGSGLKHKTASEYRSRDLPLRHTLRPMRKTLIKLPDFKKSCSFNNAAAVVESCQWVISNMSFDLDLRCETQV